MKNTWTFCFNVLRLTVIFVIVRLLLDLITGKGINDFYLAGEIFGGVVFSVTVYLLKIYEKRKIK